MELKEVEQLEKEEEQIKLLIAKHRRAISLNMAKIVNCSELNYVSSRPYVVGSPIKIVSIPAKIMTVSGSGDNLEPKPYSRPFSRSDPDPAK